MKRLKHTSDVYSPWRDTGPVPEEDLPRNSDAVLEDQDCRSYTLQVIKEGLTEVELKLSGLTLTGVESTFTAPRSTFRAYLNK